MDCQTTPNQANQSEFAATPPIAANSVPAPVPEPVEGVEALHQSVPAPVEPAIPTPANASETPLRQPLPINANKPEADQPDPSAIPPRHKPVSAGPISTIISRLDPALRHELDQAIMQHYPGLLSETYEKFDLRQRGVSISALYRYSRRVRLHATCHDVALLAPPDGRKTIDAMCLHLDAQILEILEHDTPRLDDLRQLASVRRQLTSSHLQQLKAEEIAQRLAAPIPATTAAGRLQQTMPNPVSDPAGAPALPPLARGDQGGFETDTNDVAPATRTTNDTNPIAAPAPAPPRTPRFHVDLPPFQRKTPPGPPLPEKEFLRRNRANIRAGGYGVFTDGAPATREEFLEVLNRAVKRVYNLDLPHDWCEPFPLTEENRKLCQDYLDNWKDDIGKATPAPPPKLNRNPVPLPPLPRGDTGGSLAAPTRAPEAPVAPASPLPPLTKIDNSESELPPLPRGDSGGSDGETKEVAPTTSATIDAPHLASALPPLARADQGGFAKATKEPAPATRATNTAPKPPDASTQSAQGSPHRPTHRIFDGGPWKPRLDPALEDAEDQAAKKAGRPIPFEFDT